LLGVSAGTLAFSQQQPPPAAHAPAVLMIASTKVHATHVDALQHEEAQLAAEGAAKDLKSEPVRS
jgi:hypothetical protein